MHVLMLAMAMAGHDAAGGSVPLEPSIGCTAARLERFMSPFGIAQAWPRAAALPPGFAKAAGRPIGTSGAVLDGYRQTLHVDLATRTAYVAQDGGFAGATTVFGPLPVAACPPPAPQHAAGRVATARHPASNHSPLPEVP